MEERNNRKKEEIPATTQGVVVFIIDSQGRAYAQEEIDANPTTKKKPGQISVICETSLTPEEHWCNNGIRGMVEETGIEIDQLPLVLKFSNSKYWEKIKFVDGVEATVIAIFCKDTELFMKKVENSKHTDGVRPMGFLSRGELENSPLREGVRNVLDMLGDTIFDSFNNDNEKTNLN